LSFHTPPSSSLYSLSLHDALPIFVHIDSGVSALVACLILGKRVGYPQEPMPPHSLTLTSVGTGLLWVGWFGFNAGSALEANGSADRKSTRLNSSHVAISYAVFCLK